MPPRPQAVAEQYARALLDVLHSRPERERSRVEGEVGALAGALREAPLLRSFLGSPVVEAEAKRKALARACPEAEQVTQRLIEVLLKRGRADLLPEIQAAYERLRDERQGILVAEVSSAVPLGREAQERCAEALRRSSGREVRLTPSVDPALIGGLRTRIGSQVFDGSVRARLDLLRRRLVGE